MSWICINKNRDKYNNILSYELKNTNGSRLTISSAELKNKMKKLEILVDNLRLTSDNRLIDKDINTNYEIIDDVLVKQIFAFSQLPYMCKLSFVSNSNIEQFLNKCNLMGIDVYYRYLNSHVCTVQINNDIKVLTDLEYFKIIDGNKLFTGITYDSIVLDGIDTKSLKNANMMFSRSKINKLDLSGINLENLEIANHMFWDADIRYVNFSNTHFKNLKSASSMFRGRVKDIDLTNCKMDKLEDASSMFSFVEGKILGLETIGMRNLKKADHMFSQCRLDTIDLSKWENPEIVNAYAMFYNIKTIVKLIDISSFKTNKLEDTSEMFEKSQIVVLKMPKFETDSLLNTSRMFYLTLVKEIDMSYGKFNKVQRAKEMFHQCCARTININHMKMNKYLYNDAMFLGSGALVICKDNNISRYLPQNKKNKRNK